ncbi:MAG: TIGR02996 domain-containing protein, partial [Deltaproteobacteria bacterium]|nr:TIGR02996 domain-containing protein [Deltaproteobacteria bacterium]
DLELFRGDLLAALTADGDFRVPALREHVADLPALLAPALAVVGANALDSTLLARLAALPWRGNIAELEAFVRGLSRRPSVASAVTESELLEAIIDAPDDDELRLVYGDLLVSRGDQRGDLIQVQCRLALPAFHGDPALRAAEKRLLDAHQVAWAGPVATIAGTPSTKPEVTFRRGFVERIVTTDDVLARLGAVYRVAPLLSTLALKGRLSREHWVDPAIRRICALEVELPSLDEPEVTALSSHPYFDHLEALTVSTEAEFADNDPAIAEAHLQDLAASPHLAKLKTLRFTNHRFDARMTAVLTGDAAAWSIHHLALTACAIDDAAVTSLLDGPRASALQTLDLRGNPIGDAGRARLAARSDLVVQLD